MTEEAAKGIDPKLGEDIGSVGNLYLVTVPDAEITRQRVIDYAQDGILLVPASVTKSKP